MKPNDVVTGPPLRLRAVNKETGEIVQFGLWETDQGYHIDSGIQLDDPEIWVIDIFTGVVARDGRDIYGGDVRELDGGYYIVHWNEIGAHFECLRASDRRWVDITELAEHGTHAGNVHNPAALPEEVRRMLE